MTRRVVAACGLALCVFLHGCATPTRDVAHRLDALLPSDIILLGEQHDASEHQSLQRALVLEMSRRGQLAALAIEMSEQGHSTAGLNRDANEAEVRTALRWSEAGWAWERYGPVVMAAVQNGVPVLGANLPRDAMRQAMADEKLDRLLSPAGLEQQRDKIRVGHCMLLPESQIIPMTRIQIARDAAMADTVAASSVAGKTVLLVAGGGHVLRGLGVPAHLSPVLRVRVVLAVAGSRGGATSQGADMVWQSSDLPSKDHCAGLKQQIRG